MDPITQALAALNAIIALETAVFNAAPKEIQQEVASDSLQFIHNIGAFILGLQAKINAAVLGTPATPPAKPAA